MPIRTPKVDYDVVEMAGGWDQITPTLSLKAGVARDCLNFECSTSGGYSRVAGYERYDGLAKPSNAIYQVQQVVSFTNTPTVGQTLTGNTSGATGTIIALGANYIVITKVTGTFTSTEVLKVGATTIGTGTTLTASISALLSAQYQSSAADVYRALISKVPGSGPVRGVVAFTVSGVDKVYAFRDNVGGTSTDIYVASGSSWTKINYKHEVSFTAGGTAVPADGATLTQGPNTAIVRRVMDSSGSTNWAGTTAGRFVIDAPSPGNFTAGAATLTGGATVTLSGANTAITVSPGGAYEFFQGNFSGSSSTVRMYGCDGVNRAFEFDGTTYAPIPSGLTSGDTPKHIVVHKNQLLLGVASSIIHSGPGTPFRFGATDSGGQIATGDTVTGFLVQPGSQLTAALAVYGRNQTFMLYGTGLSSWNFVAFNTGSGALHYTAQNLSQSYVLDDPGVIALNTSIQYGNFVQATLTNSIKNFVQVAKAKTSASVVQHQKSQYRVFFNDGYGLYLTIVNGKMLGVMPVYFPVYVNCAFNSNISTGDEVTYFGGSDGYVYQMDVGSSFDGANIDAFVTLGWNSMRSPRLLKRFRHASIEMQGNYYAAFQFGYQLGYGTGAINQGVVTNYASGFSPAPTWDLFTWDNFTWDGRTLFPTEVGVRGTAENIQMTISSTTNYIYPFTINSVITHYSKRRGLR